MSGKLCQALAELCRRYPRAATLVRGHARRSDGRCGDDSSSGEGGGSEQTMPLSEFARARCGAVMRLELRGAQDEATPSGPWSSPALTPPTHTGTHTHCPHTHTDTHTHCPRAHQVLLERLSAPPNQTRVGRRFSVGLQAMHRGFHTRTHADDFGVAPLVRNLAGRTWFVAWSLEEGEAARLGDRWRVRGSPSRLNEETPEAAWEDASPDGAWAALLALASATFVLVGPGDQAVIRPGAFHRVFSLTSKVALYWNYHDLLSLEEGAAAYSRDVRSGAASRGSLHTLLLQALRREAGRAGEGALRRVVAYYDTMPMTDSEKLCFASLHAEAGAASEELSRLRGEALDLSRLVARAELAEAGKL